LCEILVIYTKGHFEIQPEAAYVEVDRGEQRDLPVNYNTFSMQQGALKSKNSDSDGQHIIEARTTGVVYQLGIVAFLALRASDFVTLSA